MDSEERIAGLASIVPEAFYDLIANVLPGGFLALALVWTIPQGRSYLLGNLPTLELGAATLLLPLLLGAGYVLGKMLGDAGNLVSNIHRFAIFREVSRSHHKLLESFNGKFGILESMNDSTIENLTPDQIKRIYQQLHDYLKGAHDQARVLLPKSQAEAVLCNNLTVSLLLVLLLCVVRTYLLEVDPVPWETVVYGPGLLGLGTYLSYRAARFRSEQLIRRHYSFLGEVQRREAERLNQGEIALSNPEEVVVVFMKNRAAP